MMVNLKMEEENEREYYIKKMEINMKVYDKITKYFINHNLYSIIFIKYI